MEASRTVSLQPALAILTSKLEACEVAVSSTSIVAGVVDPADGLIVVELLMGQPDRGGDCVDDIILLLVAIWLTLTESHPSSPILKKCNRAAG